MVAFMSPFAAQAMPSASGPPGNCALFQAGYSVPLLWFLFKPPPLHAQRAQL